MGGQCVATSTEIMTPKTFLHSRYTLKCTSCPILTNSIGWVSTGRLQKNNLIPSELVC